MKQKLKIGLGIAGFILLIFIAGFAYNALKGQVDSNGNTELVAENNKASDFAITDMDGNSISLSDIIVNGKPVVLNFWASWCPPCRDEMPEFEKVYKELGEEVQFMMINLTDGMRETKEKGANYVKDQGYTFPVYFDTNQEGSVAYVSRYIPVTIFIDKDGYVLTSKEGGIDEKALREGIDLIK